MTKTELIEKTAAQCGLSKKIVGNVMGEMLELIAAELEQGGKAQLMGFGTFELRDRAARAGKNPRTGERVEIPAVKVPYFKAGKELRSRVSGTEEIL